jgi:hypothetical protein
MPSKLTFRQHAIQRMFERSISTSDVRAGIEQGEVIREYPDDTPYPSRLMLSWIAERPLHVVIATNEADDEILVITVYEPDPALWTNDFRSKK